MSEAPVPTTARLMLRPHWTDDCPAFVGFYATEASRFIGDPLPDDHVWHGFDSRVGQWAPLGFGAWAIEERESGAFLGQIAPNKPPVFPEPELGWILFPAHQGRGFAAEAARWARRFAFEGLGLPTLVSYVRRSNDRSIRLAERLGARVDHEAARPHADDLVFRHPVAKARA